MAARPLSAFADSPGAIASMLVARSSAPRGPVARFRGGVASLWRSFSGLGLMIGALFLAASLTPSLIPRSFLLQGVARRRLLRHRLRRRRPLPRDLGLARAALRNDRLARTLTWAAAAVAAAIVLSFLWKATGWQNSIRERMDMAPVESARPIEVAAIALVVFVLVMTLARLFARTFSLARRSVGRYVPERISRAIALVVAAALFLTVADGVIFRAFMRISDNSFAALDALIEPQYDAPTDPMVTGSPPRWSRWEELGRAGRQFIASGPTAEDIAAFTGRPAKRRSASTSA